MEMMQKCLGSAGAELALMEKGESGLGQKTREAWKRPGRRSRCCDTGDYSQLLIFMLKRKSVTGDSNDLPDHDLLLDVSTSQMKK